MTRCVSCVTVVPSRTLIRRLQLDAQFPSLPFPFVHGCVFAPENDPLFSRELGDSWESGSQPAVWKLAPSPPHFGMQHFLTAESWIQTGKSSSGYKDDEV